MTSCISPSSCRAAFGTGTFASPLLPTPRSEAAGPLPSGETLLFCDRHCLLGKNCDPPFLQSSSSSAAAVMTGGARLSKRTYVHPPHVFHVLAPPFLCAYSQPPPKNSLHAHFFFRYHFSANCERCQPAALNELESFPNLFVLSSVGRGGALVKVQS